MSENLSNKTNGDKIRQMSNEDLADRFGIHAMCDFCPAESAACQKGNANIKNCRQAWLDYLNAPAESEVVDDNLLMVRLSSKR